MEVTINYWAILVSAIVSQVIGMAWYSPMLFGRAWTKMMGMNINTPEDLKKMKKAAQPAYAASFIAALVMGYVLSHFIDYAGGNDITGGLQAGFWSWLGFVGTVQLTNSMYDSRPKKLFFINSGYFLVVLLAMGAILAAWQ